MAQSPPVDADAVSREREPSPGPRLALDSTDGAASSRAARAWDQLAGRPIELLALIALVTIQMWIDYRAGGISDLSHLFGTHSLNRHPLPYIGARIEYPVLTGVFMTGAAALTHSLHGYMLLSSVALWLCGVGCVCVLRSVSRKAAWCFALCPLLLVYSLLNWDLLAIFLMLLGWRAWSRRRYAGAAVWLTLGTFAKLYPAFLLLFCLVELARRRRAGDASQRDIARFLAATVTVAVIVNAPVAALAYHNWLYFWSFSAARNQSADLLSWLHLLHHTDVAATNIVLTAIVLAAAAAGARAVWRGWRVEHASALVFFAFMLMQKVYSPQYTLWLVVFALIADWEPWTIAVLSLMGLTDYANAFIHINLVQQNQTAARWYALHIFPLAQGARLLTTLAVALATAYRMATVHRTTVVTTTSRHRPAVKNQ